jgi:hypothetical protein
MLKTETVVCPCGLAQEGIDLSGLYIPQLRWATVEMKEFQKSASATGMT